MYLLELYMKNEQARDFTRYQLKVGSGEIQLTDLQQFNLTGKSKENTFDILKVGPAFRTLASIFIIYSL